MKIEKRVISVVYDQTHVNCKTELRELGPEMAWTFDRQAAERFAARQAVSTVVADDSAEILTRDDGTEARLMRSRPLDPKAEEETARAALLARLKPEERALLTGR